jgi:hypothetical protein
MLAKDTEVQKIIRKAMSESSLQTFARQICLILIKIRIKIGLRNNFTVELKA